MLKKLIVVGIAAACVMSAPVSAKHANKEFTYEVTITNLTSQANLSKTAIATHKSKFKVFELGQPNGAIGLEILAETGKAQTLVNELAANENVKYAVLLKNPTPPPEGPGNEGIRPGETLTTTIKADYEHSSISVFSMMAPSNDAFVAANSIKVPRHGKTVTIFSPVYDSGDEANTEFCYDASLGLAALTVGSDYVYRTGPNAPDPDSFVIDGDSEGLDEPRYIPVPTPPGNPTGPREAVCRLVDHSTHPEGGGNPVTHHRIPAPGIAALNLPGTGGTTGVPAEPNKGEGVVLIHRGMHGVGQLNPAMFDWRNPGAKITIRRIR
ncbi:hypothetical protein MNBD_GAMMA07-163 [hydrothermal vent metagenome]|uniref:Spondin domain-containing protein n=1 Tax=hydrothermal vent metagenome TaxID=652676 RepID=A0A3B0WGN0_9ZZZZ